MPAGNSQNVDVTVNATGLAAGSYNCNLIVTSNDPDENPVVVPVYLIVYSGTPPENFGIVTNAINNNIHIINAENNTIVGPLLSGNVGSGYLLDPVITPDGSKALISNFSEQKVYFVDINNAYSLSVGGFVNIGFAAADIALTPGGAYAVVTDGGNSTKIAVINVGTMSLIQTLDIAPREAYSVDIAPNGTVLITDYDNNQIHVMVMNLSTGLLTDGRAHAAGPPRGGRVGRQHADGRRGSFEFVALGRALIADPDLVRRIERGESGRTRCNACNRCVAEMDLGGVRCVLDNPPPTSARPVQ